MNIVVLDGYTLNPGDLSWDKLAEIGDLKVYDRTSPDDVVERAKDAEIVFTNKTKLPKEILAKLPKLEFIGVLATGYDVVDVSFAKETGVTVTNIPTYGTNAVAEMTFALIFELVRGVKLNSDAVHNGEWEKNPDFCFWKNPLAELSGKTMGFIGFGKIGKATAKVADAFGMKVIASDDFATDIPSYATMTDLVTVFKNADILSLHCPLTNETREIVNKKNLSQMKSTAYLINTARGPLINESDLAEALNSGQLAGAAVDVLSVEPPVSGNPLLSAKNCLITPHIAWAAVESRQRLLNIAVENLRSYLSKSPVNVL